MTPQFLNAAASAAAEQPGPLAIPWPVPGNPGGGRIFETFSEWCEVIVGLGLNQAVPLPERTKFERAQKLYVLGWIDGDLIKAGELIAFTALELALQSAYSGKLWWARKARLVDIE